MKITLQNQLTQANPVDSEAHELPAGRAGRESTRKGRAHR